MKIGVLDIQGSVIEHAKALKAAGVEPVFVKTAEDLAEVRGLIIPGGESTTIGKLLTRFGLREAVLKFVAEGGAVWGTCAGAILLAKEIEGKEQAEKLDLMNIVVERNAYGRQVDSFEGEIMFGEKIIPAIFIRAPKILKVGEGVEILAILEGEIMAAREGKLLATNFHPELTDDLTVHQYFVGMCG